MVLSLHTIKSAKGARHKAKVIGRGNASGHGTYSTRGQKGQKSRSGGRSGLKQKGIKQMILSFPKMRGFKSIHPKPVVLNLNDLDKIAGNIINPKVILENGLVREIRRGVKILGDGEVKRPLTVKDCEVSASAREKIEKAGGHIQ